MIFNSKFMSSMPEDNKESLFVFKTLFVTITRMQSSSWPVVLHNNTMGTKMFWVIFHFLVILQHTVYLKYIIIDNFRSIMFLLAQIVHLYLIPYLDKYVLLKLGSISSSNKLMDGLRLLKKESIIYSWWCSEIFLHLLLLNNKLDYMKMQLRKLIIPRLVHHMTC